MCVFTVASETTSRSAISRFGEPGGDQAEHFRLARRETIRQLGPDGHVRRRGRGEQPGLERRGEGHVTRDGLVQRAGVRIRSSKLGDLFVEGPPISRARYRTGAHTASVSAAHDPGRS
jgi:hypothetical protein